MKSNLWPKLKSLARAHISWFEFFMLSITVFTVLVILRGTVARILLFTLWFLYFIAKMMTISPNVQSNNLTSQANYQNEPSKNTPRLKRPDWLPWLLIGLAILAAIAIALYFIARQLPSDVQGYATFFAAASAFGAWITGIALAVFAYFQWQLRRAEHVLLYTPTISLTPVVYPKTGPIVENQTQYPYRVEWAVLIANSSKIPVLIHSIWLELRLAGGNRGKHFTFSPKDYVFEPASLATGTVFQLTPSSPQRIRWIVNGPDVGETFDYVSGSSTKRDFELVCKVTYSTPRDPTLVSREVASDSVYIPEDASWGDSKHLTY